MNEDKYYVIRLAFQIRFKDNTGTEQPGENTKKVM
jgi:hypothetical protein